MTESKAAEKNVVCMECGKDAKLTQDAESREWEGRCENCGLNVGAVYTKQRYQRALRKLEEAEQQETPKPKRRDPISYF